MSIRTASSKPFFDARTDNQEIYSVSLTGKIFYCQLFKISVNLGIITRVNVQTEKNVESHWLIYLFKISVTVTVTNCLIRLQWLKCSMFYLYIFRAWRDVMNPLKSEAVSRCESSLGNNRTPGQCSSHNDVLDMLIFTYADDGIHSISLKLIFIDK